MKISKKEKIRRIILFTGLILLIFFSIGFLMLSLFSKGSINLPSNIGRVSTNVEGAVASQQASENYNQMLVKHDSSLAENAMEAGQSYFSIPIKEKSQPVPPSEPVEVPEEKPSPALVKNEEVKIPPRPISFTQDEYKRMTEALALLDKEMNGQLFQGEIVYVQDKPSNILPVNYEEPVRIFPSNALFKTGDIYYAIVDTALNSDINSPVIATIVSGEHRKTKFIGTFARFDESLVIRFDKAVLPDGQEFAIAAYAVDPTTTMAAVASQVNTHFFSRWGGLIAASFLEGFGKAKEYSGAQVVNNALGEPTESMAFKEFSLADQAWIAAGSVGTKASEIFAQQFNRPPTVYLNTGSALGILILQPEKR